MKNRNLFRSIFSVRDKYTAIPLDITLNLYLLSKHTYEMETTYQPS